MMKWIHDMYISWIQFWHITNSGLNSPIRSTPLASQSPAFMTWELGSPVMIKKKNAASARFFIIFIILVTVLFYVAFVYYYSFITPEGSTYRIGYRYKKRDTLHTLIAPITVGHNTNSSLTIIILASKFCDASNLCQTLFASQIVIEWSSVQLWET